MHFEHKIDPATAAEQTQVIEELVGTVVTDLARWLNQRRRNAAYSKPISKAFPALRENHFFQMAALGALYELTKSLHPDEVQEDIEGLAAQVAAIIRAAHKR